jgi:hypothetical protein
MKEHNTPQTHQEQRYCDAIDVEKMRAGGSDFPRPQKNRKRYVSARARTHKPSPLKTCGAREWVGRPKELLLICFVSVTVHKLYIDNGEQCSQVGKGEQGVGPHW